MLLFQPQRSDLFLSINLHNRYLGMIYAASSPDAKKFIEIFQLCNDRRYKFIIW